MNANRPIRRIVSWSVVSIGLLVSGGADLIWNLTTQAYAEETPRTRTTTIAVIPLTNASDDHRLTPIAEAIADMLIVQLSRADSLVLVERAEIERVIRELALTNSTKNDQPQRLGKILGAQFVLSGSVLEVNGELQITEHLVDIASTRVVKSHMVRTRPDRLDRAVARLSNDLTRDLDLELPELTDEQIDKAPEANLLFMRGLGLHFARMPEEADFYLNGEKRLRAVKGVTFHNFEPGTDDVELRWDDGRRRVRNDRRTRRVGVSEGQPKIEMTL